MSSDPKRPWQEAYDNAHAFATLFQDPRSPRYRRWTPAGSIRRRRPEVGDIEHVVIPNFRADASAPPEVQRSASVGLLFDTRKPIEPSAAELKEVQVNLVWERLEELLALGQVEKAQVGESTRWGPLHRAVLFKGWKHDIFTADPQNYGSVLAIRTGPREFSKGMQGLFLKGGRYRNQDGYLRYSSGPSAGQIRPVEDEAEYLWLCGLPWIPPEQRDTFEFKKGVRR